MDKIDKDLKHYIRGTDSDSKNMTILVDAVAGISDRGLRKEAIEICLENNISFDVALRVITRPKQRRKKR